MADEDMAKVRVTRDVTIVPNETSTVLYKAGWEGTAPRSHIDQIIAAGAGEAINDAPKPAAAPQAPRPAPAPAE